MKKFYLPCTQRSQTSRRFSCIALITLLFLSITSYATHMAGGELTYRWLGGTTYEFTAKFYRDCAGVAAPTSLVLNYTSVLQGVNKNATLNVVGTGVEVSLPCASAQTTCNGGTNPGFQSWTYMDTVDIKDHSTDWVFSFSSCCRNTGITTINSPGSDNMYVEAKLNNTLEPAASSPTFSNPPILSFCAGQSYVNNRGAIDPNGDSLVYSFINPRTGPSSYVSFIAPYDSINPVSSSPPVAINALNGSISLTPNTLQLGIATVLVKKYQHGGAFVGSILSDIEILVVSCADNLPTASGINGTNVFADTVCTGSNVSFNITSNDIDAGQSVTMTWNSGIAGATFSAPSATYPSYPVGSFSWTPSAADASSIPHQFTVTVTDDACPANQSQTYTFSILVPHDTVQVTSSPIACFGNTGSATAVGSGGISPYTYSWSPSSQTTSTATALTAGVTYTVTATDNKGCTSTNSVTITTSPAIVASLIDSAEVSCHGLTDGSATVSASGGAGGFTHHWSNGQTSSTATVLAAGSYTDTVKDANNCIVLVLVTITEPTSLSAAMTSVQNVTCKGLSNGSLTVTPSGGTAPYTYSWSPAGGTDSTTTPLPKGSYTVTITDSHSCTITKADSITQPNSAVALISSVTFTGGTNIKCFGDSSGSLKIDTVMGGTGPFTYLWSTGATTDSISNLIAATYSLTITDNNSCNYDTSITLNQPQPLIISFPDFSIKAGGYNISCNGGNDGYIVSSVTGGTTPYQYLWNPGSLTTDSIGGLSANTYTLTVTDTNLCVTIDTLTLHQPTPLTATVVSRTNAGCNGDANGALRDSVIGGTPSYSHLWSNDSISSSITKLMKGIYTDTIGDANGCQFILTDSILQPDSIYSRISAATFAGNYNIACSGDSTGTAWISSVTGGTPPFNFVWNWTSSFGDPRTSTADTAINLPAGEIDVTIFDSHGCSKDTFVILAQPEPLSAFVTNVDVVCNSDSTGSITLSPFNSGTPGYTYAWSPSISTDSVATGLKAGTYSVVITDANGCQLPLVETLNQPLPLHAYLSSPTTNGGWNISCAGGSDGAINIDSVTNGYTIATYVWSGPGSYSSSSQNISGLTAGTYTVIITDVNSCVSLGDTITLHEPPALVDTLIPVVLFGGKNISCYGRSDGSIIDSISGGTPGYTYLWDTGDTTKSIDKTDSAGIHFVTITDLNGCLITDSITLTQPDSISLNPNITQAILCNGDTGCIALSPAGGTVGASGFIYSWNTSPLETLTPTLCDTAGTYRVTVTDTLGCQVVRDFTLIQPTALTTDSVVVSSYNGSGISCNGDTTSGFIHVYVSGGTGTYSHSWSNGYTADGFLNNIGAGTYTDTITDVNGCQLLVTRTLTAPPIFTAMLQDSLHGGFNITCAGNDGYIAVLASGGTRPYSYAWSPIVLPTTDSTASGLTAQTYTVVITDENGCSVTDTTTLHQSAVFNVTDSVSDYNGRGITCSGDTNGLIKVYISGGAPPYTNSWSNGQTDSVIINLGAGIYTDTITDVNGCRTFFTDTITGPQPVNLSVIDSVYNGSGVKCNGDVNGYIQLVVTGGTGSITYVWNGPVIPVGSTGTNLPAGTYSYTVTDVNGCSASNSLTLTAPPPLTDVITDSLHGGFNVTCAGNDGYISVAASGGTRPYSYTWTPPVAPPTDSTASGLTAQTYTVIITDANGCSVTDTTTLHQSAVFNVTDSVSDYNGSEITCSGDTNAFIKVFVTGGAPPYTHSWSNGQTDSIAINLGAGIYTDTITDVNGCKTFLTDTITAPQPVNISVVDSIYNGSGVKCNGDLNGYIQLVVTGGTGLITYQWSGPVIPVGSTGTNLPAGTYSYTVTDVNGCSASNSLTLTAPPPLTDVITDSIHGGFNVTCAGNDGYISVAASGGTPSYTYSWSAGGSTTSTASGLTAQTYTITITDANGCSVTDTTTLHQSATFNITDSVSNYNGQGISCNSDTNGLIKVYISGGAPPYTNSWSNGQTDSIAINLGAGIYTDTITDVNGCRAFLTDTIKGPQPINISVVDSVYGGSGVKCNGDANGFIELVVTGGTGAYTYVWSGPEIPVGSTGTNLPVGTYSYTVTDVNGCSSNDSTKITAPPVLFLSAIDSSYNGRGVKCSGDTNGFIEIVATGGTGPYTYVWSPDSSTTSSASNLPAGTYSYTVTDANGCQANNSQNLVSPNPIGESLIDSSYGGFGVKCNGDANGFIEIVVTGGTGPYTYIWSAGGSTTSTASNLIAGTYSYTVTDVNGCTTDSSITLNQRPPTVVAAGQSQQVCGDSAVLSGNSPPIGYTGTWTVVSGTGTFSNPNDSASSVSGLSFGSNTLQWLITDGFCPASATITVDAFEAVAAAGGVNDSVCPDKLSDAILKASLPSVGSGLWVSIDAATADHPLDTATTVTGLVAGDNRFLWTVTNGVCAASDTVVVHVRSSTEADCITTLELPAGFSPNGDGHNDDYDIHGIELYPNNSFKVFNRWGNEVYSVDNYKNHQWTGLNKSGDPLPEGTYFVILVINGSPAHDPLHSYVELRR